MKQEYLALLSRRYVPTKVQFPGEGRRRWCLRVLNEFWTGVMAGASHSIEGALNEDDLLEEDDPFDATLTDGPQIGVLLRTDWSDADAWQAFCARLASEEKDFLESVQPADVKMSEDTPEAEADSSDEEEEDSRLKSPIIKILDAASEPERALVHDISNIRALRLLNDVDIRDAPGLPAGTSRYNPPNRLVDLNGLQEIYSGLTVWIYDKQSNTDQCARLVSQEGDVYGTATGDSWRARVSHLCELQFNMTCLGMKIDFGGLDRYDYSERKRNIEEAEAPQQPQAQRAKRCSKYHPHLDAC